jgi:hypothetical protein
MGTFTADVKRKKRRRSPEAPPKSREETPSVDRAIVTAERRDYGRRQRPPKDKMKLFSIPKGHGYLKIGRLVIVWHDLWADRYGLWIEWDLDLKK